MSHATECDVCGKLFSDGAAEGHLQIEVSRALKCVDGGIEYESWSDVDLCVTCSAKVFALIEPALRDPA
jgi:hypothetical protein